MQCLTSGVLPPCSLCLHAVPLSFFTCCFQLKCHLLDEVMPSLSPGCDVSPSTLTCPRNYHTVRGWPAPSQQKLMHAQISTSHPAYILSMKLLKVRTRSVHHCVSWLTKHRADIGRSSHSGTNINSALRVCRGPGAFAVFTPLSAEHLKRSSPS